MQKLSYLIQKLLDARVEFVLVGGFASVAHGASLVTRDVDVCMRFSQENLARLNQALATLHPVHRMTPQRLPFDLSADAGRGLKNLYLETDLGVLDCLGEVLGVGDFDRVNAHGVDIDIPGGKCRVLDISALIQAKQAMGRPHDLLTVTQLQAIRERKRG